MQNVHIFLNKHKRERVFFSFPPKSGIPSENIADMPPADTVCVFFQDLHHQEANFLQDSDTHLSSGRLLKACFLENQYVSSNTFSPSDSVCSRSTSYSSYSKAFSWQQKHSIAFVEIVQCPHLHQLRV